MFYNYVKILNLMTLIVILFFFQGLKQKEIADLLNIKLSLVKYRVSKAKELLAKQLEVEKL